MLKSQHNIRVKRQLTILRNQTILAMVVLIGIYGSGLNQLPTQLEMMGVYDLPGLFLEEIANRRI